MQNGAKTSRLGYQLISALTSSSELGFAQINCGWKDESLNFKMDYSNASDNEVEPNS